MPRYIILFLLLSPIVSLAQKTTNEITVGDLKARLNILTSDSLAGRRTGEIGMEKTANYIAKEFKRIGLEVIDPSQTFYQRYEFSEHQFDSTKISPTKGVNVIGFLRGNDKSLSREVVIIGAHFDHLGMGGRNALDTVKAFHRGADDNASGTAGVLELAEYFVKHRNELNRSLLFMTFSGEEEGLFGSQQYVKSPLFSFDHTQAMINMDMIGRLKDSILIIEGMGTSPAWDSIFRSISSAKKPFVIRYKQDGEGPSDHASFYRKHLPVLFFFTGLHKDYHRASDTKDKLDYNGEANILKLVSEVIKQTANTLSKIPFTIVPIDTTKKSTSFKVYVGGVPDYGYDGEGLKISDVTPGSPAAKAGLLAEDIIVKFGELQIKNIYDYTNALSSLHPGDKIIALIKRGKNTIEVPIELGSRAGMH